VVDKDGKIASKPFFNLGDQELVTVLDKQTGLSAPKVNPNVQLQPGLGMDPAAVAAQQQQRNRLLSNRQILNRLRRNNLN
jgi:hypothetical protein